MRRLPIRRGAVLALAAVLVALSPGTSSADSGRYGSFELQLTGFRPRIDAEFGGTGPYAAVFGSRRGWMIRADAARSLFVDYGSLELGLGLGYFEQYGKGLLPDGTRSGDTTSFKMIPTRASLTYRLDWLAERYLVPLAPYGRLSLERYNWWVNNGAGNVATTGGRSGYGATNGWSASAGLALLLDFFDRGLAREMDRDTGINHTYLFVDLTKSSIADFGSKASWDLSDTRSVSVAGGLLFVF